MIVLFSCSSQTKSTGQVVPFLLTSDNKQLKTYPTFEEEKLLFLDSNQSKTFFVKSFLSEKEAKSYLMERRLLLLRKFETLVEPYFGTANAKECNENLSYTSIHQSETTLQVAIQLLSKGEERIIHDCLLINNSHWLKVELMVCGKQFFDIRSYVPITGARPPIRFDYKCKEEAP